MSKDFPKEDKTADLPTGLPCGIDLGLDHPFFQIYPFLTTWMAVALKEAFTSFPSLRESS